MIVAVGIHIVDLEVFRRELTDAFIQSTFLPEETRYAGSRARRHESFAGRFAAKEAVMKALGGHGPRPDWDQVEVLRNGDSGEIGIVLHGNTARRAVELGVDHVRVSISHSGRAAMALVVLEREE